MRFPTPHHIGGRYYVETVSVGRDPDSATVRDCLSCGGYVFDDEWHLVATVLDRADDARQRHVYCGDDCFRGWLRLFAGG